MKRTYKRKYQKRKTLKGGHKPLNIKPIEPLKQKYLYEAQKPYQKNKTPPITDIRISNHPLVIANKSLRSAKKATGETNLLFLVFLHLRIFNRISFVHTSTLKHTYLFWTVTDTSTST